MNKRFRNAYGIDEDTVARMSTIVKDSGFYLSNPTSCVDELQPLRHISLNIPKPVFAEDENNNYFAECTNKILAQVIDTADKAIVDAIVREAKAQGVNDLFLIDKEFIMSAIKNEMAILRTCFDMFVEMRKVDKQ